MSKEEYDNIITAAKAYATNKRIAIAHYGKKYLIQIHRELINHNIKFYHL